MVASREGQVGRGANGAAPAVKKNGVKRTPVEDLPIVEEWVLVAEAAEIAGVSRQYLHNCVDQFESASQLSGFLAFRRAEVQEWSDKRMEKIEQATKR